MNEIDSLIKVWWSLIDKSNDFDELVQTLENISDEKKIVLTTWSKDISDIIRDRLREILDITLSTENHIDITWKSRDIMTQSFCEVSDKFVWIYDLKDINSVLKRGQIPVIIQYELLKKLQPFPLVKWLSTDTSSAYFAKELDVKRFIKLTDVDWVYNDFDNKNSLLSEITTIDLKIMGKTCICLALASFLEEHNSNCYVLNWKKTINLLNFFNKWEWIFTKVSPI